MDYEKKYKEALKDMGAIYPNLKGDAKLAVEHAFPELRESEDERTREWILVYLYDGMRKYDEQFKDQFKSAITWLESLHPSWKPSEGQMRALQNAVALTACDTELVRLYNDLKKL